MRDILKTLFKYKFQILLVLILLLVQAYLDLSLPTITSNIVDIGIGQKGIESNVPMVIRESEYKKISTYLNETEKELLDVCYSKSSNYKIDEDVYELEVNSKYLAGILIYPQVILSLDTSFLGIDTNELIGYELVSELRKRYEGNEALMYQSAINYVINEYESIGINVDDISIKYIKSAGFTMLVIAVLNMVITFFSVYLSSKIMAYFGRDLRLKAVEKIMSFEGEELLKFSSASLITRCNNDVMQVQTLALVFFRIIIYAPILGFGAISKVSGSGVAWVISIPVLAILSLMILLFVVVMPRFKIFQELLDKITKVSRETLSGLTVIRAFANEKLEKKRFDAVNGEITKNGLFIGRAMALFGPTLTLIMNSVSILIVWISAERINVGSLQVGDMIALITYTMQIVSSFLMVSMVMIMMPRSMVSIKRLGEIFNTDVSIKDGNRELDKIDSIEFKNVSYIYNNASGEAISGVNFKVSKGSTIGVIGGTGSGKSTLVNLIPRFTTASTGEVLINGVDIREYNVKSLRKKIGYVPQKGWLSTGSILDNINFGNESVNIQNIENASKISQSLEFVKDRGYESTISRSGTNVSGGQRQRLSIARAIAINPDVLILDDAMSALDYKTDALLRSEINNIKKDKIIFIVATRIASVMHADYIVVLNNGEIVGKGSHEELLKKSLVYKEIKISQLGDE